MKIDRLAQLSGMFSISGPDSIACKERCPCGGENKWAHDIYERLQFILEDPENLTGSPMEQLKTVSDEIALLTEFSSEGWFQFPFGNYLSWKIEQRAQKLQELVTALKAEKAKCSCLKSGGTVK